MRYGSFAGKTEQIITGEDFAGFIVNMGRLMR